MTNYEKEGGRRQGCEGAITCWGHYTQNQFGRGVGGVGGRLKQFLDHKSSTRWHSVCYHFFVQEFPLKSNFRAQNTGQCSDLRAQKHKGSDSRAQNKIITNGGYRFYIHFYKVPTSHIPTSTILCHFHILTFPYSAMWFGHDCQTTWQNMEMDTEQFRNLQEYGRCNIYVSGTQNCILRWW